MTNGTQQNRVKVVTFFDKIELNVAHLESELLAIENGESGGTASEIIEADGEATLEFRQAGNFLEIWVVSNMHSSATEQGKEILLNILLKPGQAWNIVRDIQNDGFAKSVRVSIQ